MSKSSSAVFMVLGDGEESEAESWSEALGEMVEGRVDGCPGCSSGLPMALG